MTQDPAADSHPTRHVLVVCAGNICRSPTAEAVLRVLGADDPTVDLEVRSRGTHDWNVGRHAHPTMARIASARGYDLSRHIAAQVTADDLAWADDVLVMDDENRQQLASRYPDLIQHVRLLDATAIPDPWLVDQDPAYADALDRIEQAVRTYLGNLKAGAEQR
jgi:protein-tyrosine phosphatase